MSRAYVDYDLMKKYPNKYNLTINKIKKLKILDWDRLKKRTWHNNAMLTGNWWCHLEGANLSGHYDDYSEFWIGFNEDNDKIRCSFSTCDGMCSWTFTKFYKDVEDRYEFNTQVNTIKFLNELIDEGILGI